MFRRVVLRCYRAFNRLVYGRGSQFEAGDVDSEEGMTSLAINPADVLEGTPTTRFKKLTESGDGGSATGLWDCTAGRFRWVFHCDEVVHILKGSVTVRVGDKITELVPGSVAFFPIGTDSEWTVPQYVKKVFFHRHPTPTVKRALRV